jgi:hypothetical protein
MAHPPSAVQDDHRRPGAHRPEGMVRPDERPHVPDTDTSDQPNRALTARRLSIAAAVLVLAGGYVHFCLYRHGYRFIPKIGVSFLLQAVSSTVLAAALLVRGGRMRVGQRSVALPQLTRLSAIGLSLGTLAALGIAHTPQGLFQFREIGLRPAPQTLVAIVAESLATLLLGVAMLEGRAATRNATVTAPAAVSPARPGAREAA